MGLELGSYCALILRTKFSQSVVSLDSINRKNYRAPTTLQ